MPKFRKKPIVIEAEQFWPDRPLPFHERGPVVQSVEGEWLVTSANGPQVLAPGDWVVLEQPSPTLPPFSAYPIQAEIFSATYDPVED